VRIDDIYGDGIGYVELLDTMGDEFTPAEDARTSTNKGRLGPEKDAKLQERLSKDGHTSPFEGVIAKVEIVAPLFVLRELDRHRTTTKLGDEDLALCTPEENGRKWFARNEMSGRYVQMPNEYYHPVQVRMQSRTNKQGGGDEAADRALGETFRMRGIELTRQARELYDWAVENGIEKGLARIYNTQNQYTKIRLTGSLKNWLDFLYLRLPSVVLWECRRVAESLEQLLKAKFPSPVEQWRENVYDGIRLTKTERTAIAQLLEICSYDRLDVDDTIIQQVRARLKG
jgi:thymidylate synthase (FAD)